MSNIPILPQTHPLPIVDREAAAKMVHQIIEHTAKHFTESAIFTADVGLVPGIGRPQTTLRVERVIADLFGAESALLVQGAGSGAIRATLSAGPWAQNERRLILHNAADYSTTANTLRDGMVTPIRVDYNETEQLLKVLSESSTEWVYLQHSRQRLSDAYCPERIVAYAKTVAKRVIVDDNYAVLRTPKIGVELGAAVSAFSLFKLHGPEGIGVIVGDEDIIGRARLQNYSGGSQVQGWQALSALQSLVAAPLNWALQSEQVFELAAYLQEGNVPHVVDARVANVQDLCVIALLDLPIAERVPRAASKFGAAAYPVGSNSKYEIMPLIYRLSSSSLMDSPELANWAVRINPMRASASHTARILANAMKDIY